MISLARMPRAIVSLGVASLLVSIVSSAHAVTIDWVTVGDPGNAADTSGNPNPAGAVAETFRIMKFEWTNSQYTDFLNAVDPSGTNPNGVWALAFETPNRGGIIYDPNASVGSKYAARTNMGDKPFNFTTWWRAARVANWLQNGQGSGSTETGAYTLNNATSGIIPAVNPNAQFYIPTQDQWYKAAYYKGGGTNAGYWDYATQSDTAPTTVTADSTGIGSAGSTGNFANYNSTAIWNGSTTGNVTTVGTNGGASAYGAFDMSGNVLEWNDSGAGSTRGLRGGNFLNNAASVSSSTSLSFSGDTASGGTFGFRLASPVAVPEPSTCAMALAGLACGGYSMFRRRNRA